MKTILEIYDKNLSGTILGVELIDILNIIQPDIKKGNWFIFDLEATGKLNFEKEVYNFSEIVKDCESGYTISSLELFELANKIYQTIDITLALDNSLKIITPNYSDEKLTSSFELFIQCCDSSYWRFYSKHFPISNKINKSFSEIKRIYIDTYLSKDQIHEIVNEALNEKNILLRLKSEDKSIKKSQFENLVKEQKIALIDKIELRLRGLNSVLNRKAAQPEYDNLIRTEIDQIIDYEWNQLT